MAQRYWRAVLGVALVTALLGVPVKLSPGAAAANGLDFSPPPDDPGAMAVYELPTSPADATLSAVGDRRILTDHRLNYVFSPDDRVRKSPTTEWPSRALTHVVAVYEAGEVLCSGVLVGPNAVLTAAHCLYGFDEETKGYPKGVVILPGEDGRGKEPFGQYTAKFMSVPNGWRSTAETGTPDPQWDWGLLVLKENLSQKVGNMKIGVLSEASLGRTDWGMSTGGYPADKPLGTQWWNAKPGIVAYDAYGIYTELNAYSGQSGSPGWRTSDNLVIGVLSFSGTSRSGRKVAAFRRITEPVLTTLQSACVRLECSIDATVEAATGTPTPSAGSATSTPAPNVTPSATPMPNATASPTAAPAVTATPTAAPAPRLPAMTHTLSWPWPTGATQFHLQVTPFNGDGPAVDITGGQQTTFLLPAPPSWFGLLPDMTYAWRVRFSKDGAAWGDWTVGAPFRTPLRTAAAITASAPAQGATVASLTPTLVWAGAADDVFYWELQLSADADFGPNAALYGAFLHGGVATPRNSYQVPAGSPLAPGTSYYWHVRPRVQGDGAPVPWSTTFSFRTP